MTSTPQLTGTGLNSQRFLTGGTSGLGSGEFLDSNLIVRGTITSGSTQVVLTSTSSFDFLPTDLGTLPTSSGMYIVNVDSPEGPYVSACVYMINGAVRQITQLLGEDMTCAISPDDRIRLTNDSLASGLFSVRCLAA